MDALMARLPAHSRWLAPAGITDAPVHAKPQPTKPEQDRSLPQW